jgi:hypothetical protein
MSGPIWSSFPKIKKKHQKYLRIAKLTIMIKIFFKRIEKTIHSARSEKEKDKQTLSISSNTNKLK